jgi:uncharacterized membrane protein
MNTNEPQVGVTSGRRRLSPAERRRRREESRRLESRIAGVLRTGVALATALLTVSLPWIVFQDRSHGPHLVSVGEALRGLPSLDPRGLAALGVVVLVATPVLQLLTSAVLFWRKRDRLYLVLTLTVCAIIGLGTALAAGGHG